MATTIINVIGGFVGGAALVWFMVAIGAVTAGFIRDVRRRYF